MLLIVYNSLLGGYNSMPFAWIIFNKIGTYLIPVTLTLDIFHNASPTSRENLSTVQSPAKRKVNSWRDVASSVDRSFSDDIPEYTDVMPTTKRSVVLTTLYIKYIFVMDTP